MHRYHAVDREIDIYADVILIIGTGCSHTAVQHDTYTVDVV